MRRIGTRGNSLPHYNNFARKTNACDDQEFQNNDDKIIRPQRRRTYAGKRRRNLQWTHSSDAVQLQVYSSESSESSSSPQSNSEVTKLEYCKEFDAVAQQERRVYIWNEEAHLEMLTLVNSYKTLFVELSWPLYPIHPSALNEDNLRYVLCTSEGSQERSALSLNILFALSIGKVFGEVLCSLT